MPLLRDPVVNLEEIRLRRVSLASIDLEVKVRLENPNPLGITLRELPFVILCSSADNQQQLAAGNTGQVKISGNGSTVLQIPVTSQNSALAGALAAFFLKGGVRVTVRGSAVVDAVLFSWPVPFEKTLPVTMELVAGTLAGNQNAG